jgi:hypothetical protein
MTEAVGEANKAYVTLHVLNQSTVDKAEKADAVISTVSDQTDKIGDFLENLEIFSELSKSIGEVNSPRFITFMLSLTLF